jgi:hypothetical protein
MKKLFLTSIAALFLGTPGAAHAAQNGATLPDAFLGDWCHVPEGDGIEFYYRTEECEVEKRTRSVRLV